MTETTIVDLSEAVERLEKKNRRLRRATAGLAVLGAAAFFAAVAGGGLFSRRPSLDKDGILRVRGISVVDARGTERIFIGAPVREPLILGKRIPRGGSMNGIILFDEDGTERSGYCTSDGYPNVLFTLDGIGAQHALFMAEPQGDVALWIWNGENSLKAGVGETDAELKIQRGKTTVLEIPAAGSDSGRTPR